MSCSLKWTEDWCLASPGLSTGDVGDRFGCFLPSLPSRVRCNGASLEFSVGDLAKRAVRLCFFALVLELGYFCSLRTSPELSVRDVDRVVEVRVRRAPGLCVGG